MISRREFLGTSLGAGATLALTPGLLLALQQSGGKLIQRAIPSSGEMLQVVGLTFGNPRPDVPPAAYKEVLKTLGREGENASILGGPSWLLASTTDGHLVVARANPQKYEEVRRYQIAPSAV